MNSEAQRTQQMAQFAVLVTWHEVTGAWPSTDELRRSLELYKLGSVLLGLSRLSAVLRTWQNQVGSAEDLKLCRQFLPTYFAAIERVYQSSRNRVVFTRINLLFVAKQAAVVCSEGGQEVATAEDVEHILSCCLMANDLLLGRRPGEADSTIEKAASLLPFSDYVPQDTYARDLARNLIIFEEIVPVLGARSDFIDLGAEFQTLLGVTPRQFSELALSASIKFLTNVEEQLKNPAEALILTPEYFRQTSVPVPQVAEFLRRLAVSERALHEEARSTETLGSDFVVFQKHPLVEFDEGRFLCPDPGFLLDKAGRSLYWTLHFGLQEARRPSLMSFWGAVFERYAQWLCEAAYQGRGQFRFFPRFRDGAEAFDGCLTEGSSLLLFELKASVLSIQAKYSFSSEKLGRELNTKIVEGVEGKRKGLAQLNASLLRFLNGDEIEGLDRRNVKTIYPVLVVLDPSFVAPYMNRYYNEHFDRDTLRRTHRTRITPVFSLTMADLESVLPHTKAHSLNDILTSYWHENRNMYGSLSGSNVPVLHDGIRGIDPVGDRFHRFSEELERGIFPQPPAQGG